MCFLEWNIMDCVFHTYLSVIWKIQLPGAVMGRLRAWQIYVMSVTKLVSSNFTNLPSR